MKTGRTPWFWGGCGGRMFFMRLGHGEQSDRRAFLRAAGGVAAATAALGTVSVSDRAVAAPAAGGKVTSEQVAGAVRKAMAFLRSTQNKNGDWPRYSHVGGLTGLATLAMLNAGVSPKDPAIQAALGRLDAIPDTNVYVVSLKCQVFAAADPVGRINAIRAAANFLLSAQLADGTWTYTKTRRRTGDNSNTQFALLGLHEASKVGVPIPRKAWRRSVAHYTKTQGTDGGWGYTRRAKSYGSMTAAAVASLLICGQTLEVSGRPVFKDGANPSCGDYSKNRVLAKGLAWLTRHFTVRNNPGVGAWKYYYLYTLERVGMISGRRTFGSHDWFRAGASELVTTQKADGSWGGRGPQGACYAALSLLFLAKGNRPVLFQKVQWKGDWNRNIRDLEHLTASIGDKLGKRATWQHTSLALPVEDLRQGPILLITGHEFPTFTAAEVAKLQAFVDDAGGTLLFEACCGAKAFREGFRAFAKKTWPEYPLRPLPRSHAVFHSLHDLPDTMGLEGLDSGCRTGVFFSPKALSCLWELKVIPAHSERAFQLGLNLAAYATARDPLRDKLDIVDIPKAKPTKGRQAEIPRGAMRLARLVHAGDYNADPHAMVRLASALRTGANVDVVARSRHIRPGEKALYEYPIVFMNGHSSFRFSPAESKALREYLLRGGTLIANACCGRKPFDKSFRAMAQSLFPEKDRQLKLLPKTHPIFTGKTGIVLGEVTYRPILAKTLGSRGTNHPPVESVQIGGRDVILYSRYDWCCALQGDRPFSCLGYAEKDGGRLGMAIVLYAMKY